jgi:hypothetical protein
VRQLISFVGSLKNSFHFTAHFLAILLRRHI